MLSRWRSQNHYLCHLMHYNYIAIEGTLGAGKTTLATRIVSDFNGKLVLEEFEADENPFLPKFYQEPDKYAFQVEMTFLALRFQQLKDKLSNLDLFQNAVGPSGSRNTVVQRNASGPTARKWSKRAGRVTTL